MATTTFVSDYSHIVHSGNTAVQSIQSARQVRQFVIGMGNNLLIFISAFCALPLVFLLWAVLAYSVWRLSRQNPVRLPLNSQNYKAFRIRFKRLTELADALRPVSALTTSKVFWAVRPFAKLAIKAAKIVILHQSEMAKVIANLDTTYAPLPKGWQVLSSDERWKNRPLPYDYLV